VPYLPEDFEFTAWSDAEEYYQDLESRKITNVDRAIQWLQDWGEVREHLDCYYDDLYLRIHLDTTDEDAKKAYHTYNEDISQKESEWNNNLCKKLLGLSFLADIAKIPGYDIIIKSMQVAAALFNEEALIIGGEEDTEASKSSELHSSLTLRFKGKVLTLDAGMSHLDSKDRSVREEVYRKVAAARKSVQEPLNELMTSLIEKRVKIAKLCGHDDYPQYNFLDRRRLDYGREDCYAFHAAVQKEVKPVYNKIHELKRQRLGVDTFRPWDLHCDAYGDERIIPYKDIPDLYTRVYHMLREIDEEAARRFVQLEANDRLDLESRPKKAPVGFQTTSLSKKLPFIFLSCAQALEDLSSVVHEIGHALHSFKMYPLEVYNWKIPTSEVDELASTTMEMLVLDHLETFFDGRDDAKRAAKRIKLASLDEICRLLTWVSCIDRFQFFLYDFPDATPEDRDAKWMDIMDRYDSDVIQWGDLEWYRSLLWQRQSHIFENPFYYIEYGISQLGALSVWKRYKNDPEEAIACYKKALSLGYSRSVPEIYATAGAPFDWSPERFRDLMQFVLDEYKETAKGL